MAAIRRRIKHKGPPGKGGLFYFQEAEHGKNDYKSRGNDKWHLKTYSQW